MHSMIKFHSTPQASSFEYIPIAPAPFRCCSPGPCSFTARLVGTSTVFGGVAVAAKTMFVTLPMFRRGYGFGL